MTDPIYLNKNAWDEAKRQGMDLTGYRLIEPVPIPGNPLPEIKFDEIGIIDNPFFDWDTLTDDEKRRANDLFLLDLLESNFKARERAAQPPASRAERRRLARRKG